MKPTLDIAKVQQQAEAVLAEELYWFPVRHHSPAVARHLRAAMRERKPKLVLIEGPAEASELIKHVIDSKTKPPIALYSSFRDDGNVLGLAGIASAAPDIPPRFPVWYPMLPYSPEYVAMVEADALGADAVFIDLPNHALINPADYKHEEPAEEDEGNEGDEVEEATAPERHTWESIVVESSFYQTMARVAGYRTWDEAWDSMFEVGHRHANHEDFRKDLACFCAAVRATASDERLERDGTLARERFMLQSIRAELAKRKLKPKDAMVVCGGFHLFLDRDDKTPPPPIPKGTTLATVVPYSYFRVSELSGYGASNRAPKYYQTVWEHLAETERSRQQPKAGRDDEKRSGASAETERPSNTERSRQQPKAARDDAQRSEASAEVRRPSNTANAPRTNAERESALLRSVLAGYPDRVAKRRRPRAPELVLAAGGSATLDPASVVHDDELMVAVDAEEKKGGVVVRLASKVDPEWLLEVAPDELGEVDRLEWNASAKRVERVTRLTYGALTLEETRQPAPPSPEASALLAEQAVAAGPQAFVELERLTNWQCRVDTLRTGYPEANFPTPDPAFIKDALRALCEGLRSFKELEEASLLDLLQSRLTPQQAQLLAKEAPDKITLPGGRALKITWEPGKPPWVESRLQDFFGMVKGPMVGRTPLVLHLLAPNHNAVQVTTDLAGFWDRHYPAVRKELMRQYPRHHWPDDPRTALPLPPRRRNER